MIARCLGILNSKKGAVRQDMRISTSNHSLKRGRFVHIMVDSFSKKEDVEGLRI